MSYLELPRLHFRGRFFSDPSTRNNRKEWYPPDADTSDDPYRQNWNPGGEHRFELRGCRVGAAWNRAGALLRGEGEDPLLGGEVATPTDQGSGRMVDLDPDYQYAPQLWGVRLRIEDREGRGFSAPLETATLYPRHKLRSTLTGDLGAAGSYTGYLGAPEWDEGLVGVLAELQERSGARLSISFTLYRYGREARPGTAFGLYEGSVVGSVGPASSERTPPRVLEAHYYDAQPWGIAEAPAQSYPFRYRHGPAPAWVDRDRGRLVLDLGNGLLEEEEGGVLRRRDYGTLSVGAERLARAGVEDERVTLAGEVPLGQEDYEATAGVCELELPPEVAAEPSAWRFFVESSVVGRVLAERADGLRVEVSEPVLRLDPPLPGEAPEARRVTLRLRAFGEPAAGVELRAFALGGAETPGLSWSPSSGPTDAEGALELSMTAADPGAPRGPWVDGALYQLAFGLVAENPSERLGAIAVRVFDPHSREGTWANVGPILATYGRVYPRMGFLAVPAAVKGLLAAFPKLLLERPLEDPRYMPVTRDLSRDKRAALLAWLEAGAPIPEEGAGE